METSTLLRVSVGPRMMARCLFCLPISGRLCKPDLVLGAAGRVVLILGNNLTGTTSVSSNRTAASFTVMSNAYIKATVPTGAGHRHDQSHHASGTLSSNVPFVVPQANSCMAAFRSGLFLSGSRPRPSSEKPCDDPAENPQPRYSALI